MLSSFTSIVYSLLITAGSHFKSIPSLVHLACPVNHHMLARQVGGRPHKSKWYLLRHSTVVYRRYCTPTKLLELAAIAKTNKYQVV
jgi:hypothetical protein